jgi:hypothetical protein
VLSLGNANISFASRAAARFGGSFSYCLVDHLAPRNATGYLAFGPGQVPRTPATQTKLFLDPQMPFYGVKVDAIHVAGKALDQSQSFQNDWTVERGSWNALWEMIFHYRDEINPRSRNGNARSRNVERGTVPRSR